MKRTILLLSASFGIALMTRPDVFAAESVKNFGAVEGSVQITRNLAAQRMRFRLYPDYKPIPPPPDDAERQDEWRNIVIFLEPLDVEQSLKVQPSNEEIAQLGETFIPHVLPVVVGTTVEFPNLDPIFHNVFSLSSTKTFDLGRYTQESIRSVTFDKPGVVPVFCHLHSDMSAVVLVLETPFFTIPSSEGRYRIAQVPAGQYRLVAWHERTDKVETEILVVGGEALEIDITVPIENEEDQSR